ncbi:hypothetical protein F0562_022139 [Nyssa sinensis]|uniref:Transcription factor RAX2 n=1 Tax=Nyssa sinensis TaxID=561372 RepID=A0A5J5BQS5_9ASTE|nr:hypothetical protein F0562_022139 [Nyssa sinensis]
MGRAPCCDKANVKKGPWSPEEDSRLKDFIEKYGTGGNWIALPQKAGLKRCGKSCRLRWLNYLRPNIKHGDFSDDEDKIICSLFASIGSRWSIIAAQLPGRTDNDIKNYWNTKLKKKLMGMIPSTHRKPPPFPTIPLRTTPPPPSSSLSSLYNDCSPYYTSTNSLTGLESISAAPHNFLNTSTTTSLAINCSLLQTQDILLSPLQYYPVKDSLIMFGGDQASCSSSDGSCSQISYGKEIKQEDMGLHQSHMISNGFEENQRFMFDYGHNGSDHSLNTWSSTDLKPNGYLGNTALEYDLEEVKQLISSSSNGCNSFFFNDESKTQERALYY